ncbi:hypothetical protein MA16_Dca004907 [Dendrobium catenatum]|uniref:Uncharacterized protein n=1 Tax=Dendrobium catenatum TaxID=906689 RepID=A0A2I0WGC1_9ASPA|nr:hypothetical protein MA16_Dca004907 [Dendrobium catenatum]
MSIVPYDEQRRCLIVPDIILYEQGGEREYYKGFSAFPRGAKGELLLVLKYPERRTPGSGRREYGVFIIRGIPLYFLHFIFSLGMTTFASGGPNFMEDDMHLILEEGVLDNTAIDLGSKEIVEEGHIFKDGDLPQELSMGFFGILLEVVPWIHSGIVFSSFSWFGFCGCALHFLWVLAHLVYCFSLGMVPLCLVGIGIRLDFSFKAVAIHIKLDVKWLYIWIILVSFIYAIVDYGQWSTSAGFAIRFHGCLPDS